MDRINIYWRPRGRIPESWVWGWRGDTTSLLSFWMELSFPFLGEVTRRPAVKGQEPWPCSCIHQGPWSSQGGGPPPPQPSNSQSLSNNLQSKACHPLLHIQRLRPRQEPGVQSPPPAGRQGWM